MNVITSPIAFLKRFHRNERGSVLIMFGLCVIFLVGIGGAAIDLGRQQLMTVKLQQAADSAATSTASLTNNGTQLTNAEQQVAALRYFNLNYAVDSGESRPTPTITLANGTITIATNPQDPLTVTKTNFVSNFGQPQLYSQGVSKVAATAAAEAPPFDIVMSMDNSGSMALNINATSTNYYYTNPTRLSTLQSTARTFVQQILPDANTQNRIAANKWDDSLLGQMGFTSSQSTVNNFINGMKSEDNTDSAKGLNNAISYASQFRKGAQPVIILLTDGVNSGSDNPSIDACNTLKNNYKSIIYTIAFGKDVEPANSRARSFLSRCATGNPATNGGQDSKVTQYFFAAPNAAALTLAFNSITTSVKAIRIIK